MTESQVITVDTLRTWLLDRVAFYLELPATDIETDAKLVEYGLDSVYALTLCGDVEDEFELMVDPTIAWDYGTIDALAEKLHAELSERR